MKIKKFLVLVSFLLVLNLSSAISLNEFYSNMESNPSDYEVVYEYDDFEVSELLSSFAESKGVVFQNFISGNKNFIILDAGVPEGVAFEYESFSENYVPLEDYDYLQVFEKGEINYIGISIRSNIVFILEDFLNYLDSLDSSLTETLYYSEDSVQEFQKFDCSFFQDNSIFEKDSYDVGQEIVLSDYCNGEVLAELSCVDGNVFFESVFCESGCVQGQGKCFQGELSSLSERFYLWANGRISFFDFVTSIRSWIMSRND